MRPELQRWADTVIGRTEQFSVGVIDPLWSQRYAAAIDDMNPLYFDEAYARAHGYRGIVAPPNYLATLRGGQGFGPAESELLGDGMAPSARPPLRNLIGMGGGQTLVFHAPAYCGERIIGERTIVRVSEKEGRKGPLVIIEDECRYLTEPGELVLTLRNTLLCQWVEGGAS